MPRKVTPPKAIGPDWFLPEWMGALQMKPVDLVRETGMSKATISDIVNGRTSYYRALVNQMAGVLHIEPFELLMHPDQAFALRRLKADAIRIAAEQQAAWGAPSQNSPQWSDDDEARAAV
jgi:transcriptional regulator with XRE-family HTH domain